MIEEIFQIYINISDHVIISHFICVTSESLQLSRSSIYVFI